ncbi:MAG TPA: GWxTD domain-containing protein [Candidatus Polarisedimenticolia bacterium]|nr:GWxTD domain-containing protein [Candidatus Polarisedimenticolia bacterium]
MRVSSSCFAERSARVLAALTTAYCLGSAPALAQYQNPGSPITPEAPTPGTSGDRPRFSVDATLQLGETGRPTVRLDYRMSRSELLFERVPPAGYHAAYEVRVIFLREKGERQVTGDTYTRELRASSYAETRQRGEDIADHLDFELPPAKYRVQVAVTDLVAERISGTTLPIEVPSAPPGLVWFSDLTLGTLPLPSATGFTPNPSRHYGDNIGVFAASGEIFDKRPETPAENAYHLYYKVASETGEQVVAGDTTVARKAGRTPFVLRPRVMTAGPGTYRFFVALNVPPRAGSKEKTSTVRRDKTFEIDQSRATMGFATAQSVDVLRYVATREENDAIDKLEDNGPLAEEARKAFWDNFWKRRDPTPDTPENEARDAFYQRVSYANQHFATGGPGWRSDMGRVYILYGPPDEVDRSPFNFDSPPEERWYYYRDKRVFVFEDRDGFGRYKLVSTPTGP